MRFTEENSIVEENKNKSLIDKVWNFFASITLAVVIFALIGGTSIVGTILEQNAEPEKNVKLLIKMFGIGHETAHSLLGVLDKLGFTDMYHSWWFIALLLLFAANLIICSLDRLPRIWKLVKEPIKPLTDEQFKNIGKKELVLKGKPEKLKEAVGTAVKNAGFKFIEAREANGYQFYSEKGNYTRLGVYITHLSILLILAGAIIGITFGFKGFLNLPEGRTYSVAFAPSGFLSKEEEAEMEAIIEKLQTTEGNAQEAARQFGVDEKALKAKMKRYGIWPLGFSIRCDNFLVDFYKGSNMPKEYRSWLTVIQGGKEVVKKSIVVNDPLTYAGVTFYQSSFGMVPNAHGEFIMKITPKSGAPETRQMHRDDKFIIPGTDLQGTLKDFSPALSFDANNRPFTFAEQMNNPAVFLEFSEKGKTKYSGWIMKRYPQTWALPDGHTVEFADYWGVEYTGLQVRKDPGVWVVYLGCIVMAVGLYITFFMSHKKIWVKLLEEKSNTRIIVALTANKNRPALETKADKMIALLSKSDGGGKQ
ncbi:MAG: cytochrome c biogenesis protein ResB [Nitrospirae bacterium]|nr:MAG: cytochrome c biogenesis protein ResB [Nitrospirota bacterium]